MAWGTLSNIFVRLMPRFYHFFYWQQSNGRISNFLKQGFQQIRLRQSLYFFAMFEQNAATIAAGDANIRVSRLAGTVHFAAHDRHFLQPNDTPFRTKPFHFSLHRFRHRHKIDLRPSASRAGDDFRTILQKAATFQYSPRGANFRLRFACQTDANRLADAVEQQRTDADGRFDDATGRDTRLRNSQMQRHIALFSKQTACGDGRQNRRRL